MSFGVIKVDSAEVTKGQKLGILVSITSVEYERIKYKDTVDRDRVNLIRNTTCKRERQLNFVGCNYESFRVVAYLTEIEEKAISNYMNKSFRFKWYKDKSKKRVPTLADTLFPD